MYIDLNRYPGNWRKVSLTIRRIAGWKCELCGRRQRLTVHHRDGDKHNLQRENLQSLCETCHGSIEPARKKWRNMERQRENKRARHRALGIGSGLLVVCGGQG